jgi:hypothetical protein
MVAQTIPRIFATVCSILVVISLYGIYLLSYGSDSLVRVFGLWSFFGIGCLLWIGYIQVARRRSFWLPARFLWTLTIIYNLLFLIGFGSMAFVGLWCIVIWPICAIYLATIMLRATWK